MTLETTIDLVVRATASKTTGLVDSSSPLSKKYSVALNTGTGADKANESYHFRNTTLAASGSLALDLTGGLTDAFGDVITFTRLKAIIVKNNSTTQTLSIRGPNRGVGLGGLGAGIDLRPGGLWMHACTDATGFVVTDGSTDSITFSNSSGATADFEVILIGEV